MKKIDPKLLDHAQNTLSTISQTVKHPSLIMISFKSTPDIIGFPKYRHFNSQNNDIESVWTHGTFVVCCIIAMIFERGWSFCPSCKYVSFKLITFICSVQMFCYYCFSGILSCIRLVKYRFFFVSDFEEENVFIHIQMYLNLFLNNNVQHFPWLVVVMKWV